MPDGTDEEIKSRYLRDRLGLRSSGPPHTTLPLSGTRRHDHQSPRAEIQTIFPLPLK